MTCPICEKRKPKRFCPAKGERICAVCCGTEREVTIDCPSDCPHLTQARRYEQVHPREFPREEILFADVEVPPHLVRERQPVVSGLGFTVLKCARDHAALADADVLAAVAPLADAYRTLGSGIYFERPPDAPLAGRLYETMKAFFEDVKKQPDKQSGIPAMKDAETYLLLVFFWRVAKMRSNGRPKSRAFLDFLRAQYPASPEIQREPPRIVMP